MKKVEIVWHKYQNEKPPERRVVSNYSQIWKHKRCVYGISNKRYIFKHFDRLGGDTRAIQSRGG